MFAIKKFKENARRLHFRKLSNRQRFFEQLEQRLLLNSDWRNPARPMDVNNDMVVSPIDALIVINHLNRRSGPDSQSPLGPRTQLLSNYIDTNGDNFASPIDVLQVINHLKRRDSGANQEPVRIEGESEVAPAGFISVSFAGLPGNSSQIVELSTQMNVGREEFNELGFFVVDDANGSVRGVLPTSPNYAQTVFDFAPRQVAYSKRDLARTAKSMTFQGGQFLSVYVLQGTSDSSDPAAHLRVRSEGANAMKIGWEEHNAVTNNWPLVGDRGYDDVTISVAMGTPYDGNAAPVISNISDQSIDELKELSIQIVVMDANLPNDKIVYSFDTAPPGATIDPDTGLLRWTPTEAQGPGIFEVIVRATDRQNAFDTERFTANVLEVNRLPVFTPIGLQTINEEEQLVIQAKATDPDIPLDALRYSIDKGPTGAIIDAVTGQFRWTPSELDGPGTFNVTIRVIDRVGGSDTQSFVISVLETNKAPSITPIGAKEIEQNSELSFGVFATDADSPANPLQFSIWKGPDGATIDLATGAFKWKPSSIQNAGTYEVTVLVKDSEGADDTETFDINVLGLEVLANLEVEWVGAPEIAIADQATTIYYRITNSGPKVTKGTSWIDRIYFSSDNSLDLTSDIVVGSNPHIGELIPGASYTASFTTGGLQIPVGSYTVFVVADSENSILEQNNFDNSRSSMVGTTITNQPADLVVVDFIAPSILEFNTPLVLAWTVRNGGSGATSETKWFDRVLLSADEKPSVEDLPLVSFERNGSLNSNEHYSTHDLTVELPSFVFPASYFLILSIDSNDDVLESNEDNNRSVVLPITLTANASDLKVTLITADQIVESGGTINVSWSVKNDSSASTNVSNWYDEIYLSSNQMIEYGDILLGAVQHSNTLQPNEQYSDTRRFSMPNELVGDFFIILRTDSSYLVYEDSGETNNELSTLGKVSTEAVLKGDIEIRPRMEPDLKVSTVVLPIAPNSGQEFSLTWTVENVGQTSTDKSWHDSVFLSMDQEFDTFDDFYLGSVEHPLGLATGEFYTATHSFVAPQGRLGEQYLIIVADVNSRLAERARENNIGIVKTTITESVSTEADLVVSSILLPSHAETAQEISIDYTVSNAGSSDIQREWLDTIFLSLDEFWDIDDPVIARIPRRDGLRSGDFYTQTVTAQLPSVLPGDYRVLVRSDSQGRIGELSEDNNTGVSSNAITLTLTTLDVSSAITGTLKVGDVAYYELNNTSKDSFSVSLERLSESGFLELYVANNRMPTRSDFDAASNEWHSTKQVLIQSVGSNEKLYVLAFAREAITESIEFTLVVEPARFMVLDRDLGQGGNSGQRTLKISGADFDRSVIASLVDANGLQIFPKSYHRVSETELFATYDLIGIEAGVFDVQIEKTSTGERVILPDAFKVVLSNLDVRQPTVSVPASFVRQVQYGVVPTSISWQNNTLNDILSPVVYFRSSEKISIDYTSALSGIGRNNIQLIGFGNSNGPKGLLLPGEIVSQRLFQSIRTQEEVDFFLTYADFDSGLSYSNPRDTFNWSEILDKLTASYLSDQEFISLKAGFIATVGDTVGDFLNVVSKGLTRLGDQATRDFDVSVSKLVELAFDEFVSTTGASLSGVLEYPRFDISFESLAVKVENVQTKLVYTSKILQDGTFVFPRIIPGNYVVSFVGTATLVDPSYTVTVANNEPKLIMIPIEQGVSLSLRAEDRRSGSPIPDVAIRLQSATYAFERIAVTNADGIAEFDGLHADSYDIFATSTLHKDINSEITIPIFLSELFSTLTFDVGGVISGRVASDDGNGLSNATVTAVRQGDLLHRATSSSLNGSYVISGLQDGVWNVSFSHPDFATMQGEVVDIIENGQQVVDVNLRSGGQLSGKVVGSNGMTISNATIRVLVDQYVYSDTVSNLTGSFLTSELPDDKRLIVEISAIGFLTAREEIEALGLNEIRDGFEFQLLQAATLNGRILTSIGIPDSGIRVVLESHTLGKRFTSLTAGDGTFSFAEYDLIPGEYEISALSEKTTVKSMRVTLDPSTDTDLTLISIPTASIMVLHFRQTIVV
ncbi:MAG: CARDB domain-containing protein [Pirellulaceae bacterium]|nr:CARDB domain-containing protein [Pirellulaceae bacterium]